MSIAANVQAVQERIARAAARSGRTPQAVTLMAVTKGVGPEAIAEAHAAGVRHFGENRVQEAEAKLRALGKVRAESSWHMIGHLQTNKVQGALHLFDVIESVDSVRLAQAVSKRASGPVPVFLEVNVAGEASKGGFGPGDLGEAVARVRELGGLDVQGLMTVAPAAGNPEDVRPVFRRLCELGERHGLAGLSMGMTSDFEVAVEEGATIVRIGAGIFGPRG